MFETSVQVLQLLPNGTQLLAAAGSVLVLLDVRKELASIAEAALTGGDTVSSCMAEDSCAVCACSSGQVRLCLDSDVSCSIGVHMYVVEQASILHLHSAMLLLRRRKCAGACLGLEAGSGRRAASRSRAQSGARCCTMYGSGPRNECYRAVVGIWVSRRPSDLFQNVMTTLLVVVHCLILSCRSTPAASVHSYLHRTCRKHSTLQPTQRLWRLLVPDQS